MFNTPIGRLYGVSGVGQDRNRQQPKQENESHSQNEEKNLFEEDSQLYPDISTEEFDVEAYVKRFFNDLKQGDISEKAIRKIDEFLSIFNKERFEQKYGKGLSKEDLTIVLYGLAEKFGVKI